LTVDLKRVHAQNLCCTDGRYKTNLISKKRSTHFYVEVAATSEVTLLAALAVPLAKGTRALRRRLAPIAAQGTAPFAGGQAGHLGR
jgi:hypothetical protein